MPRKYEPLWLKILAATGERPVVVRCSAMYQYTLIQAVKKEKARYNADRKSVDAMTLGRLTITRYPDAVHFSLDYDGADL